ncbi:hypothetical protein B0J11DRAFT_483652 [Dendryphion nanum]|uniref:Complex 1 LYR protein domain-containing protein n=1 Tax=Dendryphion nanum TaxID=256645 RepID=A0A9P9E2J1_9PLEO|nr:hypothetical protein B0J11DRAFT_483652 [Dendryphion nanum]
MPRFLVPKKSTQHRVAAIALYRALLSRCSAAVLPNEHRSSLQNVIRQKFRKNAKLQGAYQIGIAFRAGYETLDHLDASSTGNTGSTNFLTSYISTLPSGLKRPPPVYPPTLPKPIATTKHPLDCLPPAQSVLAVRPRTNVFGPRHVPILSSANGIPFLRLTKPQPPSLSRILRTRLKKMDTLFHNRVLLNNYYSPLAQHEDEWDDLMRRQHGVQSEGGMYDQVRWMDAVVDSLDVNNKAWEYETGKTRTMAREMQNIVDQEMELAKQEGRKIVRGRITRWKHNRRVAT